MTDSPPITIGRIVLVRIGPHADQGPIAAIVAGLHDYSEEVDVFCFRVGFPQPLFMPKVNPAASGRYPTWEFPPRV